MPPTPASERDQARRLREYADLIDTFASSTDESTREVLKQVYEGLLSLAVEEEHEARAMEIRSGHAPEFERTLQRQTAELDRPGTRPSGLAPCCEAAESQGLPFCNECGRTTRHTHRPIGVGRYPAVDVECSECGEKGRVERGRVVWGRYHNPLSSEHAPYATTYTASVPLRPDWQEPGRRVFVVGVDENGHSTYSDSSGMIVDVLPAGGVHTESRAIVEFEPNPAFGPGRARAAFPWISLRPHSEPPPEKLRPIEEVTEEYDKAVRRSAGLE